MIDNSDDTPLFSIVCTAYNHHNYIRQTLDGFINQKTDFKFEILINDDASTDGTTEIIKEYETKYPALFRCVYHEKNQWGKIRPCKDILFPMVRGKYVALCEGDDYWTDPLKIQKQVDFLESHPDHAVCFCATRIHWEKGEFPDSINPDPSCGFDKHELTFKALLSANYINTCSVVYRWRFHKDSLNLIPDGILPGDWYLHLLHAQTGRIGFIPDVMCVYRRNSGGIWFGDWKDSKWFFNCGIPSLRFFQAAEKQFGQDYKKDKDRLSIFIYIMAVHHDRQDILKQLDEVYPPPKEWLPNINHRIKGIRILKKFVPFKSVRFKMKARMWFLEEIRDFANRKDL